MSLPVKPAHDSLHRRSVPLVVALGLMVLAMLVTLVGTVTGYLLALSSLEKTSPLLAAAQAGPQPVQANDALEPSVLPDVALADTLKGARDYLRAGSAQAKVHVVLFEDAQCPYCKQLSAGPIKQLLSDYVPGGQVAVTYRHYAFLNEWSTRLALAMECAGKQGRFWSYHDLVFDDSTTASSGELTDARLAQWAEMVKLDSVAFDACLADAGTRTLVTSDLDAGKSLRVQGTPTIFVNGKRLAGAVPYDFLKSAIDEALRTAR